MLPRRSMDSLGKIVCLARVFKRQFSSITLPGNNRLSPGQAYRPNPYLDELFNLRVKRGCGCDPKVLLKHRKYGTVADEVDINDRS